MYNTSSNTITVAAADTPANYADARRLINAYALSLDIDLAYQGFEQELRSLDFLYGPPTGALLLARRGADATGCVGIRSMRDRTCEMKRLYVLPAERGNGVGRILVDAALDAARSLGYDTVRLDTLASMTAAQRLYRSLGFREIAPYYDSPYPTVFMERRL